MPKQPYTSKEKHLAAFEAELSNAGKVLKWFIAGALVIIGVSLCR
jgi:hypothetical protein